ncbi:ParB/RepB/Spo0J family partition protein [Deinococcus multiflagellatus]|uniref:ParB/RepB/Spo0J family partition protein n=1 Tax=Deinococcus multiflagellatus TaxID=1656887 RepID=A0ABW1ZT60_9DEIO|nr:ParB/RepB/Spo0J family partition protein [Deinococcus multiflagellatus]MBZ9715367.1 ParB/RepB/Spo0J family partition protein [Deinococcus multiflagellatus]
MTRKRPERTRDIDSLIGTDLGALRQNATTSTPTATLPVAQLQPGAGQPRRAFDEASLAALAESIRAEGVLQPLLVRPVDGGHEIVAGERRWRAAQLAGLTEVPVLIRTLDDRQARAAALIENLQRENLNVIDEVDGKLALVALALNTDAESARTRLMQLLKSERGPDHATVESVFASLGESWLSFAKNKLRVLRWPAPLVEALRAGLPLTVGSVIASAPESQQEALITAALAGASRGELQSMVERAKAEQQPKSRIMATHAAKVLSSRRFMDQLAPADRQAVEKWLERMPAVLRPDQT